MKKTMGIIDLEALKSDIYALYDECLDRTTPFHRKLDLFIVLTLIQFVKTIDNKKFVIKEIRTISSLRKMKLSRVVFHTMYKMKATKTMS